MVRIGVRMVVYKCEYERIRPPGVSGTDLGLRRTDGSQIGPAMPDRHKTRHHGCFFFFFGFEASAGGRVGLMELWV